MTRNRDLIHNSNPSTEMASSNPTDSDTKQDTDIASDLHAVLVRLDARSKKTREELNKLAVFVRNQSMLQCEIMSKLSDQVYLISQLLGVLPQEPIPEEHDQEEEEGDDGNGGEYVIAGEEGEEQQ